MTPNRSTLFVAVAISAACSRAADKNTASLELRQLFESDQAERRVAPEKIDWPRVRMEDRLRRERAAAILKRSSGLGADDYYRAAMVFQHGEALEDIETAHALALRAVELRPDYREARWLAAAALDRQLMMKGLPQKYGTQYKRIHGRFELYPVDPSTSDVERSLWAVPTLDEAKAIPDQTDEPDIGSRETR
jgi:hypothetical protein